MKTVIAKPALRLLLGVDDYKKEQDVSVVGVWDIEQEKSNGSRNPEFEKVAQNLCGTEATVRRYAQEAFGWGAFCRWRIVPSKTRMTGVINIGRLLSECGIPDTPITED